MSYHRTGLGMPPAFTSTQAFAQAVDPYSMRFSPPGSIYSPYGWGPDFNVGMPMNYTHHIDYVQTPVRGPMYDRVNPYLGNYDTSGGIFDGENVVDGNMQSLADSGDGLSGMLAVM